MERVSLTAGVVAVSVYAFAAVAGEVAVGELDPGVMVEDLIFIKVSEAVLAYSSAVDLLLHVKNSKNLCVFYHKILASV